MSLGAPIKAHRKRAKSYRGMTEAYLRSFKVHISTGDCLNARKTLISAAEAAGAAYAEDQGNTRRKRIALGRHPAIKMVAAAGEMMRKKCVVSFAGKKKKSSAH